MSAADQLIAEVVSFYGKEGDHKSQAQRLKDISVKVFATHANKPEELTQLIRRLVETVVNHESTSMVVSRQFINDIAEKLDQSKLSPEVTKAIANSLLEVLSQRAIAYEEQSTRIRLILAGVQEQEKAFREAAQTLIGIPLESGQRSYPAEFKMNTYLRITELCLEAEAPEEAELQVNRASLLQNDIKDEGLLLRYKAVYARVLDRRGRFIEAAQRYYELSLKPGLTPSEKKHVLQNALTCTLLAPPGIQRNRLLNTLFKDERCSALSGHSILRSMYLERLIKPEELTEFEATLHPHQKVVDADGASILQRSVMEHNMLAASKLYANISFESLGDLLGISSDRAEKIATELISSERLPGSIDQLEQLVSFEVQGPLAQMDSHIVSVCEHVNAISEMIAAAHPEWHNSVVSKFITTGAQAAFDPAVAADNA
ncbi:PCI domain containing protein [Aphelenchoides avenae]|nr:PCI domain containing protein [Aphelenchus avenae]